MENILEFQFLIALWSLIFFFLKYFWPNMFMIMLVFFLGCYKECGDVLCYFHINNFVCFNEKEKSDRVTPVILLCSFQIVNMFHSCLEECRIYVWRSLLVTQNKPSKWKCGYCHANHPRKGSFLGGLGVFRKTFMWFFNRCRSKFPS